MQICLGLETSDAKMWMVETVTIATQHGNFPERFLIVSPHEKLRFCILQKRLRLLLVMQYRFSRYGKLALQVPTFQTQPLLHLIPGTHDEERE